MSEIIQQQQNIKDIIKQEYIRCANDPIHFAKKYCQIQHPQRGKIPFHLYPFQEKVLTLFRKHPYSIILKSRQLGISTLVAEFALWMMLFSENKTILVICTKQDTAKNMVQKVAFMWENLPSWLNDKKKCKENNKLSLTLLNGSKIVAASAASDSARSYASSMLIIDEAAFIENIEETFVAASQTLATGGNCIVLSTPYGTGNWFHQTWQKAETNVEGNKFIPIKLPWSVHPERTQKWRDEQDVILGAKNAAQECDCNFETSGDIVFPSDILEFYEQTYCETPMEKRGIDANLWIWESPDFTRTYMVTADVARGDGKDYSAFHVIDVESATQVAEYKGQIGTTEFGNLLVAISTEYNDALLVVDNRNIGWSTIQTILERGYKNLYYSPKGEIDLVQTYTNSWDDNHNMTPGFTISTRNRPMIVAKFGEYLIDRGVTIKSKRLLEEMKVFVWKNGKAEAQQGYNDDLTMAFAQGLYVRDTALKFRQNGLDLTRASLNGLVNNNYNYSYQGAYNPSQTFNPKDQWRMNTGHNNEPENIDWLL